jgi:hypothetical protein
VATPQQQQQQQQQQRQQQGVTQVLLSRKLPLRLQQMQQQGQGFLQVRLLFWRGLWVSSC